MAPFGLFKKKKGDEPLSEQSAVSQQEAKSLSIKDAQVLLQELEAASVKAMSSRLSPIKSSADQSLKTIEALASDLEHEKIKLVDLEQRYKSLVENSRKTIVGTLRRESATVLELPESVSDMRKFKDKFEVLLKRLGEVSGSHSKVLNNFMKKHASKMRGEIESLQELYKESKSMISKFDQDRLPIVKCNGILNTSSQKVASIQASASSIDSMQSEISSYDQELEGLNSALELLKNSPGYQAAELISRDLQNVEGQREELRNKTLELFSHASRAFTKYSYGVSKETEARLNLMSVEPWRLLEMQDASEYVSLISEVRKSVSSGNIQLKDSEKVVSYIDTITQSLPDIQARSKQLGDEVRSLKNKDFSLFVEAGRLEQKISETKERISRTNDAVNLLKRQNEERKAEVSSLLMEASTLLSSISGQKYSLYY